MILNVDMLDISKKKIMLIGVCVLMLGFSHFF